MKRRQKKLLKIFAIAGSVDLLENLILLTFFSVPITSNSFIGAGIFALVFTGLYNIMENFK